MYARRRASRLLLGTSLPAARKKTRRAFVVKSAVRKASPFQEALFGKSRGSSSSSSSSSFSDFGACAVAKGGLITDTSGFTWVKSATRNISLPVFASQTPISFSDAKSPAHLSERLNKDGSPLVFGQNNEIVIAASLSAGQDGVIFQGYYAGIPYRVVLKMPNKPIAHAGLAEGCGAPTSSDEEQAYFDEILREYDMMSTVKCGAREGPIVCALGAAAVILAGKVYAVIALEFMETTSIKYVKEIAKQYGPAVAAKQAVTVVLKAYRCMKDLHAVGIMHMDAHSENWLVKSKNRSLINVDVRMVDLGRSCTFGKPGSVDDCAAMASHTTDPLYTDYAFYGLIEFTQFSGFVWEILSLALRQLPKEIHGMLYGIRNMYQKYSDYYYDFRMSSIPPQMASKPFEYFIEACKLEPMLAYLVGSSGFFTPAEIGVLAADNLIPPSSY